MPRFNRPAILLESVRPPVDRGVNQQRDRLYGAFPRRRRYCQDLSDEILYVGRVDNWYGILAGVIIVVGFIRATVAAKGWAYYSVNVFFWAKIATFIVVALLSVPPTVAIIRWRKALKSDAAFAPPADAIRRVRSFLWAEAALFLLLPVFAAAMARGYGELTP